MNDAPILLNDIGPFLIRKQPYAAIVVEENYDQERVRWAWPSA